MGEGLWGAGVFLNVRFWPLWVCGKEKEAKVHMRQGQFCQSEEKQTAPVTTSRLAWPSEGSPPAPAELALPASGETVPTGAGGWSFPPAPPPASLGPLGLYQVARLHSCPGAIHGYTGGVWEQMGASVLPTSAPAWRGTEGLRLESAGFRFCKQQYAHLCNIRHPCTHHMYTTHHTYTPPTHTHTQKAFALASDGISPIAPGLTRGQQRASLPAHLEAQRTLRSSVHHQPQERAAPWPSCGPKPQVREYTLPGTSNLKSSRCPGNPWGLTLLALSNISHLDHSISTICPLGAISPPLATLSPYHTQPLASEAGSELGIQRPWASRPL